MGNKASLKKSPESTAAYPPITGIGKPGILLIWAHDCCPLFGRLSRNLLREISEFLVSHSLVWVFENQLAYLNHRALRLDVAIPLTLTLETEEASWLLVNEVKVLVCGGKAEGGSALKCAYEVYHTGTVQVLPDMNCGRSYCGLVMWQRAVYAFGSFHVSGGTTCERLSSLEPAWQEVGEMLKRRAQFTPVIWQEAVFLCGGFPHNSSVERYDGRFRLVLDLKQGDNAVSCVCGDTLVVLTSHYLSLVSFQEGSYRLETRQHRPCSVYPRAGVLVMDNMIVTLYWNQVFRNSLQDGRRLD